jgi:uncharacterized protein GlcG (DUF336 family)
MKIRSRKRSLVSLSGITTLACVAVLCLSCGGGGSSSLSSTLLNPPPTTPVQLTAADVQAIVQNAVTSVNAPMVVAVVDRAGNILAVFETSGAPAMSMNLGQMVHSDDLAVGLARTAAFFSNDHAPLSSRTVRFISGVHFPPGVLGTPNAPLYGIENTNRGCTLSNNFLPGQMLNPSLNLDGSFGSTGIVTGKLDTNDSPLPSGEISVNPGGMPLFNGGVVGGVGVVSTSTDIAEFAAFRTAFPNGVPPLPPPGVVMIGGVALPFVTQTSLPAGSSPGSMASYTGGTYIFPAPPNSISGGTPPPEKWLVGPNAGSMLAVTDVNEIIMNAVATATMTRAVIRLPSDLSTRMTIAVSDLDGTILGLYRMNDGTVFSVDVAASKARNVVWFSAAGVSDLAGVPTGTAVTNRTISFGAQPMFPPGIDYSGDGPFFPLYLYDTMHPCTQGLSSQAFMPNTKNMSGVVFFPGSVPIYRNGVLVGGLGVSGDGVDQDDFVTAGAVNAACGAGGPCGVPDFQAPANIRADQVVIQNVRLPYLKFPRNPTQP